MSNNTNLSKAIEGLQTLRINGDTSKMDKDGFITVQHSRPPHSSAKIGSMRLGGASHTPSTTNTVIGGGSIVNGPVPVRPAPSIPIAERSPPTTRNNGYTPQRMGSRMGAPSTIAAGRLSANNSNWREARVPDSIDETSVPAFKGPEQWVSQAKSSSHHANTKMQYPRNFYKPGMIIRGNLHEDDFNSANTTFTYEPPAKGITPSEFGNIHTKTRKFIVVAVYDKHYTAVPIYTHNGRGLANKNADEYISVRDHRDTSASYEGQSKHGFLVTQYIHDGIRLFDHLSTAHITYPVSRKYDNPVVHVSTSLVFLRIPSL